MTDQGAAATATDAPTDSPDLTKCMGCDRPFKLGEQVFLPNDAKTPMIFCRVCFKRDKVRCRVALYGGGSSSTVGRSRLLKNRKRLAREMKRQGKAARRAASQQVRRP